MNEQIKNGLIHYPSGAATIKYNLICFPFAGGGTVNYGRWRADLHPDIGLYAFCLPGRERFFNQPCLTDFASLVKDIASVLSSQPDIPQLFFGHSYGALTAYFTALELQKLKAPGPSHLYISARLPPNHPLHSIANLDTQEFITVLLERYQGIPKEILSNQGLMDIFIPIIKKDFKLYEQYPEVFSSYANPIVPCNITTIGYSGDVYQKEGAMEGWQRYTQNTYQHLELSGGHFEILSDWSAAVSLINQCVAHRS